ncbi:hypothetical protein M2137_001801 [Parabacteroides sp. PFB2-10]|nr:hypothetical protein [Parabacteroides sp. PFB2-10]
MSRFSRKCFVKTKRISTFVNVNYVRSREAKAVTSRTIFVLLKCSPYSKSKDKTLILRYGL